MAFVVNEPQDTTKLSTIGTVIRPNWLAIQDGESTFKQKALNLPNRTPLVEPNDPVTIADTNLLYAKDDARAISELYTMSEGGIAYQLTTSVDAKTTFFGTNPGWTFLPGGLIMQYGSIAAPGDNVGTRTFPFTFPTAILQVQISVESTDASRTVSVHTFTTAQFEWITSNRTNVQNYHWMAIGN